MVGSIVAVGVLTCALFYSMYVLKAVLMNVQHNLIQELMFYKFELSYHTAETIKKSRCNLLLYSNQMVQEFFLRLQEP